MDDLTLFGTDESQSDLPVREDTTDAPDQGADDSIGLLGFWRDDA